MKEGRLAFKTYGYLDKLKKIVFNLQLITKFFMKTKSFPARLIEQVKSVNESAIQDSLPFMINTQKVRSLGNKIDTTVSSISQNELSTTFFTHKGSEKARNEESTLQMSQNQQKSRKYSKKKKIEKKKVLRSNSHKGKFGKILRSSQPKINNQKIRKLNRTDKKTKIYTKKQIIIVEKTQPLEVKKKQIKPLRKEQKAVRINLDDCVDIRMLGFDRKQLQKKRQDLLKRVVDDWELVDKARSHRRQLRNFIV